MTDRSNYQQVGVDVDEQSFGKLIQRIENAQSSIVQLKQANLALADSAKSVELGVDQSFKTIKSSIDANIKSIKAMRDEVKALDTDAAGGVLVHGKYGAGAQALGYGTEGGMIGPAAPDNSGGDGGGDSFNISGARRAGSFLTRIGLPQIGQPLQIIGGLQSVEKVLDSVGTSVKAVVPAFAGLDATLVGTATALAPLAILVGGVVIGLKIYNDSLAESAKQLGNAKVALDTYYKAIQTGTTDSVQKQLDTLKAQKANIDAETKNIQTALDNGFKSATQQFGGDLGGRLVTGLASATNEQFRGLGDRLTELKRQSADLDGQMQGLGTALDSAAVKANDLAEATLKNADLTAASQIEQYKLIREGTSKQIQGIIDDNKDKVQAYTYELAELQKIANPNDDIKKRIAELKDQITQLGAESLAVTQNVLPLVKAREAEAEALKTLNAQVQAAQKLRDEQAQKEVDAVKKMNDGITAAETSADQARLNAAQKLQDALVNAAQKAVDDANKALDQLTQKRADNLTSLTRDEDKITRDANDQQIADQVKAQRQERDDLQQHLQNIQQIKNRDASRERDDLLNRNYRDLFALKESQNTDIGNENTRYSTQTQQRQQALQDQEQDQARAIQVQRRERLIAYQQANQDALKQYNIELVAAADAKAKAIQIAQQANQKELANIRSELVNKQALLRQGAINEINLVMQTEQTKQKIFQDELNQARQLVGQSTTTTKYNSPQTIAQDTGRAEGGSVDAYRPVMVNDRKGGGQRESFNGLLLPRGLGLFIPAQSGYVNPGGTNGPISVNIPITINGVNDPVAMGNIIDQHLRVSVPIEVSRILK